MGFEDDYINELYAIHSKYEKPMKLNNLNNEIKQNTNTIKTLE